MAVRMIRLKVVRGANVVLMCLCAFAAAAIFLDFKFMKEGYLFDKPPREQVKVRKSGSERFNGYSVILEKGLFAPTGELSYLNIVPKPKKRVAVKVDQNRSVMANGSVILLGTIVGEGGKGYAIFEEKLTRKQEVVKAGERVFSVGELKDVETDRVTLKGPAGIMTYEMPHLDKNFARAPAPGNAPFRAQPPRAPRRQVRPPRPAGEPSIGSDPAGPIKRRRRPPAPHSPPAMQMPPSISDSIGKRIETAYFGKGFIGIIDDAALLKTLSGVPPAYFSFTLTSGEPVAGYLIDSTEPDGFAALLGLKFGDLITEANGRELDGTKKWEELMALLRSEEALTLVIRRDGALKTLRYEIK
ncbi:MAG: hypothetical protein V3T30_05635 [Thermodesulfobacteriota bacterium]